MTPTETRELLELARLRAENAELRKVFKEAKNLIEQHGRHNTAIAYERLRFAVATMKEQT